MLDNVDIEKLADSLAIRMAALPPHQRLMDITATATYLGRSTAAVKQMVQRGRLPVTTIDKKLQFDRIALDKLINDSTIWQIKG